MIIAHRMLPIYKQHKILQLNNLIVWQMYADNLALLARSNREFNRVEELDVADWTIE